MGERIRSWAQQRPERVRGRSPWMFTVRLGRQIIDDRVTGLAAEMAFFALLSLVPLLIACGAALGFAERAMGEERVAQGEDVVIGGLDIVFSPELADEVVAPFVRGLLAQERAGLALGSLLVTLWLASRVFTATIRALDLAYGVEDRRNPAIQRTLAIAFALGAIVAVTLTLMLLVVGPLLGGGRQLAAWLGLGPAFEIVWAVGRWPVLAVVAVAFFAVVYRYGPAVHHPWRHCLPGAVAGVVLWILVTVGFRVYLEAGGPQAPEFGAEQEALAAAGGVVGALVAAVLWIYLSGVVILVGGELNAELAASSRSSTAPTARVGAGSPDGEQEEA